MLEFTNEQSYKTPMNLTLQVNDEQYQQKQHFRVLKRCSENMLQIYKKPPMAKSDFNKVATEVTLWHGRSLVNLLHIFRTPFSMNTTEGLSLPLYKPLVALSWLIYSFLKKSNLKSMFIV